MTERIVIDDTALKMRVDSIIAQLREYYPDGKVSRLNEQHKTLSNKVGVIWQELGYENRDAFFAAYGFEFVRESGGGRPRIDAEALISELADR